MINRTILKTVALFIVLIIAVVGLSLISAKIWGDKPEKLPKPDTLIIERGMTVAQFGQTNNLSNQVLREIFGLQAKSDLENTLETYGTPPQISALVLKKLALASEHASKNWIKILVKFFFWAVFLVTVYMIFNKRKVSQRLRKWMLFTAILIFGVILGSDPSPMGTVKDAIYLYGSTGAIFPPRIIALTVFLACVFLVNKYICAWGCQVGTLQDLIFHINRTGKKKAVFGKQIKLPFVLTNTLRIAFLGIFTIVAFLWGIDIVEPIDPFKIFNPGHVVLAGSIFIVALLVASLFIYRPWCHIFCPFGLVGWLIEKISRVRVNVNYETCIACEKCAAACPTTVMSAILKNDKKTIPDCFSCYACRDVCPTGSVRYSTDKRTVPPAGHFDKQKIVK
ncbi:MAG: 4Fe-4S binding protein [Deltaproteobacteria bacterium]|nr:4Fe-4S binding protein [Deltaproteobacteria bacterium]